MRVVQWRYGAGPVKIGITFDLREAYLAEGYSEEDTAEFDHPDTIAAIEKALKDLGYETDRIGHVKDLMQRLLAGDRWDLVFNIAEGLRGYAREAQIPCLLDAYEIPYTFSDPLILALTLHKGMTKHVIRDLGIPTPDFAVVEKEEDLERIDLPFPLFAKPVAEGTGKGITAGSRVTSRSEMNRACMEILQRFGQPALVEAFLPGREFTVGIRGTGKESAVIAVMEVMFTGHAHDGTYSYETKKNYEERVSYHLVNDSVAEKAGEVALVAWRGLGCRDAGRIDLRADVHGVPNFIEVNPLAGLHPVDSDLPILCGLAGIGYGELIRGIMDSALKRLR